MFYVVRPGLLLISISIWLPSKPAGPPQHSPSYLSRLFSSGPNEQPINNILKYSTFYFPTLNRFSFPVIRECQMKNTYFIFFDLQF